MKFLIVLITLLVSQIAAAQYRAPRMPQTGPVDGPGIGRFEQKQNVAKLVKQLVVDSGLAADMSEQPKDLSNLQKVLVKAALADERILDDLREEVDVNIPAIKKITNVKEREKKLFTLKMQITMVAGMYGYSESDS